MAISEQIGETAAGILIPGASDVFSGKRDEVLAQSGIDLFGIEDSFISQALQQAVVPLVRGARRYVTDTLTQTRGSTVTASDILENGSLPDAVDNRQRQEYQDTYVSPETTENTDKASTELTKKTFQQLGYSEEQASQKAQDTVAGGLLKGGYNSGLRKYEQVAAEAADSLYTRKGTINNTNVPGNNTGTAGNAGLTATTLHSELLSHAIEGKDFRGLSGDDINTLAKDRIHSGKYDTAKNDIERGERIAADVAGDAESVRNLRKVYGEGASTEDMMKHTTALRGSDVRTMSKSRRDALTAEAANVAANTGMDSRQMAVAAARGYEAAAEYGLEKEAGYRIGLSAQKQIGGQGIRVEGLDADQYRREVSAVMAAEAESGTVTDSAAAYRAYLDASGKKDTDETFSQWQESTRNVDFADTEQAQKYIAKTLGVSGSKAAEAYDAYSRSTDTKRMAESRDFYSAAFQKRTDAISEIGYKEQSRALKEAGIKLNKVFDSKEEYNSLTQQERRDKIRDYAKENGKDIVAVEAALSRSDERFKTTAEFHGMSAEAADQAIVASRSSEKVANRSRASAGTQYSAGMEGVAQLVTDNQKRGKDTTVADLATAMLTGTDRESLKAGSQQVDAAIGKLELPSAEVGSKSVASTSSSENRAMDLVQRSTVSNSSKSNGSGDDSGLGALTDKATSIITEVSSKTDNEALMGVLNNMLQCLQQLRDRMG